jgi:uncharacterized protein YbbC (DUF1343 family)
MQSKFAVMVLLACAVACGVGRAGVQLGIDVLAADGFAPLKGKRVGLVTNQTGVDGSGAKTRAVLKRHVDLVALYTPEHGLDGTEPAGKYVASRRDPLTGVMAHSLYGPTRKPTAAMLRGVDVLVYDMQDIGCRSYTYISTMIKCMEACGDLGIPFLVLDRPNPLGGLRVEGPPMEARWISFIGQVPTPYVHGMTAGEIARMANASGWVSARCKLDVVPMRGWKRSMMWSDTGLRWVRPSPNIPRAESSAYYVATGLAGELPCDVGCGGPTPFEVFGARGADPARMVAAVEAARMPGVSVEPWSRAPFGGVRLRLDKRAANDFTALNMYLLVEAERQGAGMFKRASADKLSLFYKAYGSESVRAQVAKGVSAAKIVAGWEPSVQRFKAARRPHLMYD